jgi:hypothetical protein
MQRGLLTNEEFEAEKQKLLTKPRRCVQGVRLESR